MESDLKFARNLGDWMAATDRFARSLGIRLVESGPGSCRAEMTIREEMLNSLGMAHGGATYSLADFAFAVACNTRRQAAVALNTTMVYTAAGRLGDRLVAIAGEESLGKRTATYRIRIERDGGDLLALFTGTAYRRDDEITRYMEG